MHSITYQVWVDPSRTNNSAVVQLGPQQRSRRLARHSAFVERARLFSGDV
jgi:hypothetical protein